MSASASVRVSTYPYKYVGWCLPKSLSINLSVYLHYGFLATSKQQKNFINKTDGTNLILQIDITSSVHLNTSPVYNLLFHILSMLESTQR